MKNIVRQFFRKNMHPTMSTFWAVVFVLDVLILICLVLLVPWMLRDFKPYQLVNCGLFCVAFCALLGMMFGD